MRLEYLPLLRKALTAPLQPTADNNSGKDGIATVMELMNAYGLSKYSPLRTPARPTASFSSVCARHEPQSARACPPYHMLRDDSAPLVEDEGRHPSSWPKSGMFSRRTFYGRDGGMDEPQG